ncbi:Xaa-Pro peptidase family protein [Rhizobium sp. 18055]|uniref:M24 family metallopeptidase n=1 Tax=Rhizobium sp. 18055 TaxID=2681403 RepID=UPI00135A6010|nr:Xaa-Pro peptidase family protein [Rhizobium sp. 18055]
MTETQSGNLSFDNHKLDRLLEQAGLDAVLITSKHNIQYLLGGYRYFFYSFMDAHGLSRYLPFIVYVRGNLDKAAYVGSPMERFEKDLGKFWMSKTDFTSMTTVKYAAAAAAHLQKVGLASGRIGIEPGYLPVDAYEALRSALPEAKLENATFPLELLRTVKTPTELAILKAASEKVIDSMAAVFATHGPGSTKNELIAALRKEEQDRGLLFEYCLCNIGTDFNRAPSNQVWKDGEVLCLDSGGNYQGYIGDLARMAYAGKPDSELEDLLGFIEEVQQAARKPIKPGALGGEIYVVPDQLVAKSPLKANLEFVAHGMGIVSHEGPWLTDRCSVPYEAYHAGQPLEAGMVLSIETTLHHPKRGFIKLEDTVVVTDTSWESYGDGARGWNG